MTDLFITGTDTNIGKTLISTGLALHLDMEYFKPIQSGTSEITDSEYVKSMQIEVHPEVYKLTKPLSPHLSAEIDNIEINLDKITRPKTTKNLIIEGAGGVLVPINKTEYIIDIITNLNTPAIIVSSSKLGTINHTLLTINALKSRNINIFGIIFTGDRNIQNEKAIFERSGVDILGNVKNINSITRDNLLKNEDFIEISRNIKDKIANFNKSAIL